MTGFNYRRKHRRIATGWLSLRAVNSYTPVLDRESIVLVKALYGASKGGLVPVNPQVQYIFMLVASEFSLMCWIGL